MSIDRTTKFTLGHVSSPHLSLHEDKKRRTREHRGDKPNRPTRDEAHFPVFQERTPPTVDKAALILRHGTFTINQIDRSLRLGIYRASFSSGRRGLTNHSCNCRRSKRPRHDLLPVEGKYLVDKNTTTSVVRGCGIATALRRKHRKTPKKNKCVPESRTATGASLVKRPGNDRPSASGIDRDEATLKRNELANLLRIRQRRHVCAETPLLILPLGKRAHLHWSCHFANLSPSPYFSSKRLNCSRAKPGDDKKDCTRNLSLIRPVWTQMAARYSAFRTCVVTPS